MEDMRYAHNISVRKPEGKNHFGNLEINGIILKWILKT
jgi:hypothetical protein